MPIEEKIMLMESLWESLIEDSEQIPIPKWHEDVVKGRDASYIKGTEKLINWNEAKKRIRDSINNQ